MINCNCVSEGYCSFYNRQLWGQHWSQAHNINCTEEQHVYIRDMLLRSKPQQPAPTIAQPEPQVIAGGLPKKPCNCGQRSAEATQQLKARRDANAERWRKQRAASIDKG